MENDRLSKKQLLDLILKNEECDLQDEEIIHLLLEQNVSANTDKKVKGSYTLGQRTADSIARFTGSWVFIIIFLSVLVLWMLVNVLALSTRAFDPYPFILLNLVLSCVAAIQAPLIMMSQNRQEEKDRARAENDYRVNLKNEFIIRDIHKKMDAILENQRRIMKELKPEEQTRR